MRLSYILLAAMSTLSVHQVPVAVADVTSLADPSVSDQSRVLRGNKVAEDDEEERGFADIVEQLMAKDLVSKMVKTQSFSALDKVDDLARLEKISTAADDHLTSVFKFADDANMSPSDLAKHLKSIPEADDAISKKAVALYTNYLKGDK